VKNDFKYVETPATVKRKIKNRKTRPCGIFEGKDIGPGVYVIISQAHPKNYIGKNNKRNNSAWLVFVFKVVISAVYGV
jgi:hypothetical protein